MYRVLITDDEKIEREGIKFLLAQEEGEYEIHEAANGRQALNVLRSEEIDFLLTDIKMPHMDGLELASKVREEYPNLPIVIFSGYSDFAFAQEAMRYGVKDYVLKPVDPDTFHTTIGKVKAELQSIRSKKQKEEKGKNFLLQYFLQTYLYSGNEEVLKKAMEIMEQHLDDVEFSTEEFAREMCMSRSSLHLKMKALTGESTNDFIRKIRFNRACKLLKEGRYTVAEISVMVGFSTPSYFATSFKKYFGCLPSEYIKNK